MKSATPEQKTDLDKVLDTGRYYINKMPLDKSPEILRKNFSINMDLFNYLIQLARMCESSDLVQKRKIKSLQNRLFIILADDKYYDQAIKVLKAYIMPDGKCSLKDVERADFFGVLFLLENQRNKSDLEIHEIVELYNAMDPNHGNISVVDVLPTGGGDISSIETALLREENIGSCEDNSVVTKQTLFEPVENEFVIQKDGNNFRDNFVEYTNQFELPAEQVLELRNKEKLASLKKIFTNYESQLKKSWVYVGKADKLADVQEVLGMFDGKKNLQLVKDKIFEKQHALSKNRENCVTSVANCIQAGVSGLCSMLGLWRAKEKKSNGKLAIEEAIKVLGRP